MTKPKNENPYPKMGSVGNHVVTDNSKVNVNLLEDNKHLLDKVVKLQERIQELEEVLNSVYDSRAYDIIIHYDAELAKRINRLPECS